MSPLLGSVCDTSRRIVRLGIASDWGGSLSASSSAHAAPPARGRAFGRPSSPVRPAVTQGPSRGRAVASRLPLLIGAGATTLSLIFAIVVLAFLSAPAQLFAGFSLPPPLVWQETQSEWSAQSSVRTTLRSCGCRLV